MNQRKVAGAASEVSNQNEFVAFERGLVIMGRRHRLQFELDLLEPRQLISFPEPPFRIQVIFFGLGAHKTHWTSGNRRGDSNSELLLRFFAQIAKNPRDEILDRDA